MPTLIRGTSQANNNIQSKTIWTKDVAIFIDVERDVIIDIVKIGYRTQGELLQILEDHAAWLIDENGLGHVVGKTDIASVGVCQAS